MHWLCRYATQFEWLQPTKTSAAIILSGKLESQDALGVFCHLAVFPGTDGILSIRSHLKKAPACTLAWLGARSAWG